jgi:hypothetical protein
LKYRSVLKEVDSFAASRLVVTYSAPIEKPGTPAQCIVGSDMKFYLISLDDGAMMFFPSMSSLDNHNYLLLEGHRCPIINLAVSEDQISFYTLGQSDKMLL